MSHEQILKEHEVELVKHLRKEAYDVKQCFTQYSFQGLAIVVGILGIAIKFAEHDPYIGLVGIPLTILLMTIARIGTHKYATANRLLGYELHLQRLRRYPLVGIKGWNDRMRDMGWEEALRAWRIVQATVFEFLYIHGNLATRTSASGWTHRYLSTIKILKRAFLFWHTDRLRPELINSDGKPVDLPAARWFETRSLLGKGIAYYPGGYLQSMLNVIYLTATLCIIFSLSTGIRLWITGNTHISLVTLAVVVLFSYYALGRFVRTYRRRILLEEGFLSINSCAVLWQVTACAHFTTLIKLNNKDKYEYFSYKDYSKKLGEEAIKFANSVFNLYDWYQEIDVSSFNTVSPTFDVNGERNT